MTRGDAPPGDASQAPPPIGEKESGAPLDSAQSTQPDQALDLAPTSDSDPGPEPEPNVVRIVLKDAAGKRAPTGEMGQVRADLALCRGAVDGMTRLAAAL